MMNILALADVCRSSVHVNEGSGEGEGGGRT